MARLLDRAAESLSVFRTVLSSGPLLRVQIAFAGFCTAELGVWVAITVWAYQRGGATEAGLVALAQLVPAAIAAPFGAGFGDRYRRDRFLMAGYAIEAAAMGAVGAAMIAGVPGWVVVAGAAAANTAVSLTRPAHAAILPGLVRTPDELTAANVATGAIESASFLAGPAVAGVIMGWFSHPQDTGPGAVLLTMAGVMVVSASLAASLPPQPRPAGAIESGTMLRQALAGFRTIGHRPDARLIVGLGGVAAVLEGAIDVFEVVVAIGLLHLGTSGPGYLAAAIGAGGLVGSALALLLVGRRGLARPVAAGLSLYGIPIMIVGAGSGVALVFLLLGAAGAGAMLADVAGRTLLQRVVPDDVLSRVFGVLEGLYMAGLAVGAVGAAALVDLLGAREALLVVGAIPPVAALLAVRPLGAVDRHTAVPVERIETIRSVPMFGPLSEPVVERLARNLVAVDAARGTTVIRQGEPGDRYYIVRSGRLDVTIDGTPAGTLGPGSGFGEIALLRDVPRTASVTAASDASLYALEREVFLESVTGHPSAVRFAEETVRGHLEREDSIGPD